MSLRFVIYLILLAVIFFRGLADFNRLSVPMKYMEYLIGITLLSESISGVVIQTGMNNFPVYHFFTCIQYAGTALVFYAYFKKKLFRQAAFYSILPVTLLGFINSLFIQDINTFPSNILLVSHGIFLILALLLFKEMMDQPLELNVFKQSIFWFATAYLFFPATVFLSFGLQNYFRRHQLDLTPLNLLTNYANLIFYALIGVALMVDANQTPKSLYDRRK